MKVHTCDPALQKDEQFKVKFSFLGFEVSLSCMRLLSEKSKGVGRKKMNKY